MIMQEMAGITKSLENRLQRGYIERMDKEWWSETYVNETK